MLVRPPFVRSCQGAIQTKRLLSEVYTHGHHPSVVQQHAARTAESCAAYLLPKLRPCFSLLDIGCGPGSITLGLAKRVSSTVGVDNSAEVLNQARHAAADIAIIAADRPDVSFVEGSVYDLPFPDGTFDVVHAHQLLQHLSDPVAALAEMRRVVKPGGRGLLAVRDAIYSTMRGAPTSTAINRWRELYMATCRMNKAEPDAGLFLQQWALHAGFASEDVTFGASTLVYSRATGEASRRAWGDAWAERSLHSGFAKQALAYGLADTHELESIAAGWKQWGGNPDACFLYVNGELLAISP